MPTETSVLRKPPHPVLEHARSGARWAVVLAGGKGARMQSFVKRWLGQVGKPPAFPVALAADEPQTSDGPRRHRMATANDKGTLYIDYPAVGEVVQSTHYTFRLSAPEGVSYVEYSVDCGDWQPCRSSCGFWWADWSGYKPGEHSLRARAVTPEGDPIDSLTRRFSVAEPHPR